MRAQCNCKSHCRTWEETQNGKYPASDHAPSCDLYKLEDFARITHEISHVIVEMHEVDDFKEDAESIEIIQLTRDQFEKLPEFMGF